MVVVAVVVAIVAVILVAAAVVEAAVVAEEPEAAVAEQVLVELAVWEAVEETLLAAVRRAGFPWGEEPALEGGSLPEEQPAVVAEAVGWVVLALGLALVLQVVSVVPEAAAAVALAP